MKKKLLLFLSMFLFITNVSALTFNVNLTNIEDKGNNGTIGSIEKIDLEKKELDVFFQDIGDEVNFSLTIENTGDRAGTLREINFETSNDKIEYTSNLPDGGLAIDGNGSNEVIITAKVKNGAVNGKTTSSIKVKYTYDEGSCPDGEILSEDESMCLCPEGLERNEKGICVKPEKEIVCEKDEIYNAEKKICEKKVVPTPDKKPINPANPKTLDNIILITLLFMVSGLGIYAVMFKKLKTSKKKITVGAITGVITLSLSFTVLASVFGLDNLLSAIVNPITKSREITLTVNEEIELIETWDGECSLDNNNLTPNKIFQGGTGTESDPYQIKTAEQLSCFAKSVNNGETYQGKFIKQTKNIKLNDKVLENIEAGTTNNLNTWTPIGEVVVDTVNNTTTIINSFNGTYDGDNKVISGMYINNPDKDYLGLFSAIDTANIKNLTLSDNYLNGRNYISTLVAMVGAETNPTTSFIDNIKTYGKINGYSNVSGIVGNARSLPQVDNTKITNSENYADVTATNTTAIGISVYNSNVINSKNYGNVIALDNAAGICGYSCYVIDSENHGEITGEGSASGIGRSNTIIFSSDNYGKIVGKEIGGEVTYSPAHEGISGSGTAIDCNNYGDVDTIFSAATGIAYGGARSYNSTNTGTIKIHDNQSLSNVNISTINNGGTTMITDEELPTQSFIPVYSEIMGKDFVSRNTKTTNTGDIYVTNINTNGISVGMIAIGGSNPVVNTESTGSIYITNVTSQGSSDYFTMLGNSGNNSTNVKSIGDMIIDNYTGNYFNVAGVGAGGPNGTNVSSEGTIEIKNSTLTGGQWSSASYIAGGTTAGARMTNSFVKGNIKVHDNNFNAGVQIGSLAGSGCGATTSYSETEIEVYNNNGSKLVVGGLATDGGMGITNSYNRGNINIYDNSFNDMVVSGGAAGPMYLNGGNYNSGDIYVKDNYATSIKISGAGINGPYFNNYYNLGNITLETENNTRLTTLEVGGLFVNNSEQSNLVNAGNITIPYVPSVTNLSVGGLIAKHTDPRLTNVYNTGNITIGDGYTYSENINYGNVFGTKGTEYNPTGAVPSAYYTNDGYAFGLSRLGSPYVEYDANYATKVNASEVPSILDIINVNDAFEIKEGETLPTLKVFNN